MSCTCFLRVWQSMHCSHQSSLDALIASVWGLSWLTLLPTLWTGPIFHSRSRYWSMGSQQAIKVWLVLLTGVWALKLLSVERYLGHPGFPLLKWCNVETEGNQPVCGWSNILLLARLSRSWHHGCPTFRHSHNQWDATPWKGDASTWSHIFFGQPEECVGDSAMYDLRKLPGSPARLPGLDFR